MMSVAVDTAAAMSMSVSKGPPDLPVLKLTLFMSERTPTTTSLLSLRGTCSCEMATAPSAAIAELPKRASSRMQLTTTGLPG